MLFTTSVDFKAVSDDALYSLLEWTEAIREASVDAELPAYVQQCDERLSAIQYEMTCRMCDTEEYTEWLISSGALDHPEE